MRAKSSGFPCYNQFIIFWKFTNYRAMATTNEAVKILKSGGIGILPTDTIYGLVGMALSNRTVKRIYEVRKRNPKKPLVILISGVADLKKFNIALDKESESLLNQLWPGKVSVILPCKAGKFEYLHRSTKGLAFRLPAKRPLRNLIRKTGPLVAPSANPEGFPPAKNLKEAREYFGDQVDFYLGSGGLESLPSTLIEIKNGKIKVLRQGEVKINVKTNGKQSAKN